MLIAGAGKVKSKKLACVGEVMSNALKNQPCYSIAPDSGKEFDLHSQISDTLEKVIFYFPFLIRLGKGEQMKIQMDYFENIFRGYEEKSVNKILL